MSYSRCATFAAAAAMLIGVSTDAGAQTGLDLLKRTDAEKAAMRGPTRRVATRRMSYVDSAAVENAFVRVIIPFPNDDGAPDKSVVDYFAWVIDWEAKTPFTVVLMADTAMRTTNVREILGVSTVRLCPSDAIVTVRECVKPLKSVVTIENGQIQVILSDTAFVARVRRERPPQYVIGSIGQRGRVESVAVPLIYRDSKVNR